MSTFEEVNAAILAYQQAFTARQITFAAAQAAQLAFEAATVAGQQLVDDALAAKAASEVVAQTALNDANDVDGLATYELDLALTAMAAAVEAYVPPEP
jgi:hypothetical protein